MKSVAKPSDDGYNRFKVKKRIITITGAIGSGKSTTAKRLAAEFGYKHFSSGDLFRALAKERGISIEQINKQAELEKEIDHAVDERLKELNDESDLVIDSRLAFHWIPESFKVYMTVDPDVAAKRIYEGIRKEGRVSQMADSAEHVREATAERLASEKKRYLDLYGIDIDDHGGFDLVVDTSKEDEMGDAQKKVSAAYRSWLTHA